LNVQRRRDKARASRLEPQRTRLKPPSRRARGLETRRRVVEAAIDAFAERGFAGTSTRHLVSRAGASLVAIHYHFGSKRALYRSAAEHIAETIRARGSKKLAAARAVARRPGASRTELIEAVCDLFDRAAAFALTGLPDTWRRFLIREQVDPTGAFEIVFGAMRPFFQTTAALIARLIGRSPQHPEVRLLTLMIFGQVSVFRTNHAAALRLLGWRRVGERELRQVRRTSRVYIYRLFNETPETGPRR
jgi:AcrR family transcriptional regulator